MSNQIIKHNLKVPPLKYLQKARSSKESILIFEHSFTTQIIMKKSLHDFFLIIFQPDSFIPENIILTLKAQILYPCQSQKLNGTLTFLNN